MYKIDKIRIEYGLELCLGGAFKPAFLDRYIVVHFPAYPLPDQFRSFLRFPLVVRERTSPCVRRAEPEKFVLRVVA